MAAPAFAQDANSNDSAAPASNSEETVTVVGSRIRRDAYSTASPVQVINREESTLAGLASTTEILQSNGATGGASQINNYFGGFVVDGGPGVNTLSLRGLGATRTLILLNGRRLAPAGTRGAVGAADLNVLPNAIVDRIEILKDGASSIYGSDAVAGVVNVITETGVEGWTLEGQYNATEAGGGEQLRSSVVGGYTADDWEISGSFEYYDRSPLTLGDRGWAACQTAGLRDPSTGESLDFVDPRTGAPKCYPTGATGEGGVTINTIGTANIGFATNFVAAAGAPPVCDPNGDFVSCFFRANRWRPNSAVTTGLPGFEAVGGAATDPTASFLVGTSLDIRDTFDPRMFNQTIVSPASTYTGFLQGSYDLHALGNAELYFELLGTKRKSEQVGFRQLAADYPNGSPLLSDNFDGISAAQSESPHPTVFGIRAFIGFGNDHSSQEVDYYKSVFGIRGQLGGEWHYDADLMYAKSDATYTFESFLWDRLTASLNGCAAFPGMPTGFSFDGCVVAPALDTKVIGGDLPTAWTNYMFRPVTGNTTFDETTVSAVVDGPLFQLPAGPLQAVFGVEHRRSSINDQPPEDAINGNLYNLTSGVVTKGSDSVTEVFTELEAPLVANAPFAEELTLNVSGRYTEYDSYGSDTTYKLGGIWRPAGWLSFRATYGTSFRAPALFEQFLGATTGFLSAQADPCANYGSLSTSSNRFINCNAELNDLGFTQPTSGITVISSGGAGTGSLAAETSDNLTYGFVLQPSLPAAFGDLSFAVDYYKIEVTNEVEQIGAGSILSLCYDDPQFRNGGGFCNLVSQRDPTSKALTVNDSYTNIATQIVEGYDYNIRYVRDIGLGTFRVNSTITQYVHQQNKLFPTDPLEDNNGTLRFPEWTATTDFTYDYKAWKFRYSLDWLQSQDSNALLEVDPTSDPFSFKVPGYTLQNASVQYTSTNDWQFVVGVRNLTDEDPPTIPAFAYNRIGNALLYSGYDYFGRQYFVNVSKHF